MGFHRFSALVHWFAEKVTDDAVVFLPRRLYRLLDVAAAQAVAQVLRERAAWHDRRATELAVGGLTEDLLALALWHRAEVAVLRKRADAELFSIAGGEWR